MAKNAKPPKKKDGFFSKVKEKFIALKDMYWHRQIIIRTILLALSTFLIVSFVAYGFHHKSVVQTERAMRVSDLSQELTFSKTGTEAKLDPQSRSKNMVVIPLQLNGEENMSFNAKDYKVFLKSSNGDPLPSNISASFVVFGTTKEAAIVLRGDLKKEPMQVILRNDENFGNTDDGPGQIMLDGKMQDVDYNAIAFTVNPKGDNVKKDDRIKPDMSMSNLFSVALGDRQLKSLDKDQKIGEKQLKDAEDKHAELERRINQLNDALGRDKNDFKLNDNAASESDAVNGIVDENSVGDLNKLDLSSADMEALRNSLITERTTAEDAIASAKSNLEGVKEQRKNVHELIDRMDRLVSVSDKYDVVE